MNRCLQCKKKLIKSQRLFCSNQCQSDNRYQKFISKWKSNKVDGTRGLSTKNISNHIRRYLFNKYKNKCSNCGWNQRNPVTNAIPLEIDHIDGNSQNNKEENLRLICPNCHSLSKNFRNLNKGKGRKWRKNKYIKLA